MSELQRLVLVRILVGSVIICGIFGSIETLLFINQHNDASIKEKTYACKVLDKMPSIETHHSKSGYYMQRYLTLILQTAEGKQFSLDVEPVTFSQSDVGDTLFFTLKGYELDVYNGTPVWVVFRPCLLYFVIPFIWVIILMGYITLAKNWY